MKKKVFKNGTLKSKGYFMNGETKQEVEEAIYEGETPLSAENLNDMQNNIEAVISVNEIDPLFPVTPDFVLNVTWKTSCVDLTNIFFVKDIFPDEAV